MSKKYNNSDAVEYAKKYATSPNNSYIKFEDDCTNFISQCLQAGGAENYFHPTHPWWYKNGKASICWTVASSLYWHIRVCTENNLLGIKADTYYLNNSNKFNNSIALNLQLGDIIQYRNSKGVIAHSAIITYFDQTKDYKEPLISQHSTNAVNISWRKEIFIQTIFHHITSVN